MHKRTKIICTIGPASEKKAVLEKMVAAGMNVARLNFSHGTYQNHQLLINNLRAVSSKLGVPIAILQDLQGPRIRTGELPKSGIALQAGKTVTLVWAGRSSKTAVQSQTVVPIQYDLSKVVRKGTRILINDGLFELRVVKFHPGKSTVDCAVVRGGVVLSHRGMNIPKTKIDAPSITYRDKEDLKFGLRAGVDWVALSFVREAHDVLQLKKLIRQYQPSSRVKVIAKIERQEAVDHFDEILAVADGIMVARGDLGIELPAFDIPVIQKRIVSQCLEAHKPVIIATQMMESMMEKPRPTRAEVSDVANAVADHADAVMLSGETATGKYPVEVVQMMSQTIRKMENSPYDDLVVNRDVHYRSTELGVADAAARLVKKLKAKAIVTIAENETVPEALVRFRPETKIIVLTTQDKLRQQLALIWGVTAMTHSGKVPFSALPTLARQLALKYQLAKAGQTIIVVGDEVGSGKTLELLKVVKV
ncbi:pyruvate kinase [Candidatus Falkowbacteria bacterium]|nr:pyruvate kinase [Candidatus Falkowbacteria bacterium]